MRKRIRLCVVDDEGDSHDIYLNVDTVVFKKFYQDYVHNNRRSELLSGPLNWRDPSLPATWSSRYATRYAFRCDGVEGGVRMKFLIRTFNDGVRNNNIYLWLCAFNPLSIFDEWADEAWNVYLKIKDISKIAKFGKALNSVVKFKILKQ